jgi:hypothetical protein
LLVADEPLAFAGRVIALLQDKDMFEKTRFEARELVCSDYAWGKIGSGLNEIIQQITISHTTFN